MKTLNDLFIEIDNSSINDDPEPTARTVVRLKTSAYQGVNGFVVKKELIYLKRKCQGWDCLGDFYDNCGGLETESVIINLYEEPDGIYEIVMTNMILDRETGYVDDWELKLVPYVEEEEEEHEDKS